MAEVHTRVHYLGLIVTLKSRVSIMENKTEKPRILIVTPEVTHLPEGMGNAANYLSAKAGGLADVSAALIEALFEQDADVHVALPDYRSIFSDHIPSLVKREYNNIREIVPEERIHLAEDRAFFYRRKIYSYDGMENLKLSLAFQREVINHIVPAVQPDLIHCNDWMTALIPAMARRFGIPCLFTVHNIHTVKNTLAYIEDRGIDAAEFWQYLFFLYPPYYYEETRESNPVDFLASGVFAAHFVNTVSPTFLLEIVEGRHGFIESLLQRELTNKWHAGCAGGILNAPDPSFNPKDDTDLVQPYTPANHVQGKRANKIFLQKKLGLIQDSEAPIFFWPHRLDRVQKGCRLLAEILYRVVSSYWDRNLQIVFVASGDFMKHFDDIVNFHDFHSRVAVWEFDERLARLAYAASDFMLMPSLFEPCGLPQMIGPIYGSLPVARDTGGIHDTVTHLNVSNNTGNGFLFETYDSNGLFWAITQAMEFYGLPKGVRRTQIDRIMKESVAAFNHANTAKQYIELYEKMLERPLINY